MPAERLAHDGPRPPVLAGMLFCAVLAGCGAETYKTRLNGTAEYFGYKQKLSQELGPNWSVGGVTLQPPKQFQVIAPPPPPPDEEDGEAPDAGKDPRQPHYLGIHLPGLLGAWQATVRAEVGGVDEDRTAYLYVLGNHSRYLEGPDDSGLSEDPQTYLTEIENLITGTIGVVLPEGETGTGTEKNQRYREEAPRGMPNSKFTPQKNFIAVMLSPQIDPVVDSTFDLPIEMQLYEWGGQKIQLAILMVYPKSISPQERLHDRLLLSLETLSINDTPPVAGAGSAGGGGGAPQPAGF